MTTSAKEIKVNLLDILILMAKWKKTIALTVFIFVAAAVAYALLTEKVYTATAVVIPKEEEENPMLGYLKGVSMAKSKLGGNIFSPANDEENKYLGLLKSRRLQLDVINKFGLIKVYKFNRRERFYIEDVLREFGKHIAFDITNEGNLYINVQDSDPSRAADIANYMVEKLDEIYKNLSVETAQYRRMFLENRLQIVRKNMADAEDSLSRFQMQNGIINVSAQGKATIEAAASMEEHLLSSELDLNIAKNVYSPDNNRINEMEMKIRELKKQREAMENTRDGDLILPLKVAPELGIQCIRLERNVRVQEMIFELITEQYESAKLEEARSTPHVQILDKADPPQKRTKPKRTRIVAGAFVLSLLFSFALINLLEAFKKMKTEKTDNYQKLNLFLRTGLSLKSGR